VWGGACSVLGGPPRPSRTENCGTWVCSENGLPDDPLWGRLGYVMWLDTAQDLFQSKVTHPLDNTDLTSTMAQEAERRSCRTIHFRYAVAPRYDTRWRAPPHNTRQAAKGIGTDCRNLIKRKCTIRIALK